MLENYKLLKAIEIATQKMQSIDHIEQFELHSGTAFPWIDNWEWYLCFRIKMKDVTKRSFMMIEVNLQTHKVQIVNEK